VHAGFFPFDDRLSKSGMHSMPYGTKCACPLSPPPKKLAVLDLAGTRVTDAGLAHLAGLTNLRTLRLEDTQVTDAGLKYLAPLKKLTELDLRGTRVTDAGLEVLAGFPNLQKLLLDKSQATDAGVAKLQKARPKLDVNF
jgi:hypothetical protein